jgi:hypothetical protein
MQRTDMQETAMTQSQTKLSRRKVFAGAGAVGALAAVAAVLPGTPQPAVQAEAPKPQPDDRDGYKLTEHIQRYYQTARV